MSKNSQQNISETVTNEHDKEIPKEIYVSPEERQEDYTTGCLLGYNYFNNYYKMIAIDLSKQ